MLHISQLSVAVQDHVVIHDCSVTFQSGLVHIVMGPNGSGKSSLAHTIMGHPSYEVRHGSIMWHDQDITHMSVFKRATQGIFLALQHPVEIQGLQVLHFIKELYGLREGKAVSLEFVMQQVQPLLQIVGFSDQILNRYVNVGFSGGEKKRFELLQMFILQPKLVILDELDSGVDIDGLKQLAQGLLWYRQQHPDSTLICITHYRHIVQYLNPDHVHVMMQGSIVASGNREMFDAIDQSGYGQYAKRS